MLSRRFAGILTPMAKKKNAAAVALGKLGGKARARSLSAAERSESARKAGKSRITSLTDYERAEIAKKAARARWAKRKGSGR